jgi:hypothetical protein
MLTLDLRGGCEMWARVVTFEGGDMDKMKAEVERRLREKGGFPETMRGIVVLADRAENRRTFVALFETREEMDVAEPAMNRMREEIPEEIRGQRRSLDYFEVLALHMT